MNVLFLLHTMETVVKNSTDFEQVSERPDFNSTI
jgi:hypothetical protein